jgi:hypothetical protein
LNAVLTRPDGAEKDSQGTIFNSDFVVNIPLIKQAAKGLPVRAVRLVGKSAQLIGTTARQPSLGAGY